MSRAAQSQVAQVAEGQDKQDTQNAQQSYTDAQDSVSKQQGDITAYQDQLSKFAADNPYGEGGAFQTDVNKSTANTADAASEAAKQAGVSSAVRTGLNANGGVAAGDAVSEANTRALTAQQAKANADRISQGAGYGSKVLSATQIPASLQGAITGDESKLSGQNLEAAGQALSEDEKESTRGSLGEEAGDAAIKAAATAAVACWIAAELYDGWFDPRTIDVRTWLFGPFRGRWYGRLLTNVYLAGGERVAGWIKRFPSLRRIFLPIFNAALARARKENNG